MATENDNIIFNIINGLGYVVAPLTFLIAVTGWYPILICFYSYSYAIGWNEGWIGRWAFFELLFFVSATVLIIVLTASRIELGQLPEGWQFLRAFSFRPTRGDGANALFERVENADVKFPMIEGVFHMTDEDDQTTHDLDKPSGYTSGRPRTTLPQRIPLGKLIPVYVDSKLEGVRQHLSQKEIDSQIATLAKQTAANQILKANIESNTGLIESNANLRHAPDRAERKNQLDEKRDNLEAVKIDRDIENIKNPSINPGSASLKESDFDDFADDLLRTGASGPHQRKAEAKIALFTQEIGGESKLKDEDHKRIRRLRAEATRRDKEL